ncbi:hypothetical protein FN976_18685 [Caenimonas sedimenti]|uniref:SH3b domain-containing protein n=1 Tax=Caenimonas sedimenti TaxID=2596921 RepID=A0A562ZMU7_9BURK|nr:hypothetical protein [Caenimonas sedimenti]TWO69843.1 hypothetical protein FN976_18685 [Caenimonas sedimenti]
MIGSAIASAAVAATMTSAIVTTDQAVLRAGPRDSAPQQAQLWQGEVLEVRGERLDYLQVWDHRRERGGYVKASQVKRTALAPTEAPDILAVLRFVRETPGSEALGIGLAAAWLQAAPAEAVRGEAGTETLDALGQLGERLAQRASGQAGLSKNGQAAVSAHLEVAARYGVKFVSYERDSQMRICYDGEAFRRVLALAARPEQKARAALALTQPECMDPNLKPLERHQVNLWRADVLERVDTAALPATAKNQVAMRRASVWSTVAYERARLGQGPDAAAQRAIAELTQVQRSELTDDDQSRYNDAAMRVNASRWAAMPPAAAQPLGPRPSIVTEAGQPGETCVLLVDAKNDVRNPLARRCTFSLVWAQSASLNREGNALALAVQPMEAWRELWLFRKTGKSWAIDVLPPATLQPELGYAEFAGWVPGGQQVLVAREARGEGKYKRNYEVLSLDNLVTQRQTGDPSALGPFQRWQDPSWKRMSVALR